MQITIEVPDSVAAIANEQGLTPERYAERVILSTASVSQEPHPKITWDEFMERFPIRDRQLPQLSNEDLRRENMYDDHC